MPGAAGLAVALGIGAAAAADSERPLRLVAGFPPGGIVDVTARTVGPRRPLSA